MSDVKDQNDENKDNVKDPDDKGVKTPEITPEMQAIIDAKLDEKLKDIKGKLDNAYKARDDAAAKLAEKERLERDAEIKRMEDEGKHREVAELRLKEKETELQTANQRIVELTRDRNISEALNALDFRNKKAQASAAREISEELRQDDKGQWVHKSGKPMAEFIESFFQQEDNSSLYLKPKVSSGGGSGKTTPTQNNNSGSLFGKSQEEVLKMAREGKLRRQ